MKEKGVIVYMDRSVNIHAPVNNALINTGDEATQSFSQTNGVSDDVFSAFIAEINKLKEGEEKENALSDVNILQEAVKKGNWERAKGVFKLFSETLRTSAAGVTVAKVIGLIPPLP